MSEEKIPPILAALQRDHRHFARIIAVLEHELERIRNGESEDWKLLADSFEYFEAYPDLVHHPCEDILYRYCRDSCDASLPALEGLEIEHGQIAKITTTLRQELEGILADGMIDRELLARQVQEYLAMQKAHMRREETKIFPLLRELLRDEDWETLEKVATAAVDPLFDDASRRAYDALYRGIVSRGKPG